MRTLRSCLAAAVIVFLAAALLPAQVDKAREKEKGRENPKDLSRGSLFGGKNLDQWMALLKSKDPSTRENAIATLKLYGPVAREAVPTLIGLTKDRDVSVRVNTAIALGLIGMDERDAPEGVASLIRLLGDTQAIVRFQAAVALRRLGADARAAIPALIQALRSDTSLSSHSWEIRRAAAAALGEVAVDKQDGPDPRATTALTGSFVDISSQVRLEAVLAIVVLGRPTNPTDKALVERELLRTLKDPDKHVAIWGHIAMMRLDRVTDAHLAGIAKHLKNPEATVRAHVGRAFAQIGPESKSRLPELIDALQVEEEPLTIYWIVAAMVSMGDPAPRALDALKKLQQEKNPGLSQMATDALEMLQKGKMRPEKTAGK